MSDGKVCPCGKGYMSEWDGLCGHCRTKNQTKALHQMREEAAEKERVRQFRIRQREERHARNEKGPQ